MNDLQAFAELRKIAALLVARGWVQREDFFVRPKHPEEAYGHAEAIREELSKYTKNRPR